MLQLLSPFWFIALAGLTVPVLIHLWNKKQPRVIKVGSIRWLLASANPKARSLRFRDWPLLLLRCLLLATLAVVLVQPVWKQKIPVIPQKYAWVAPPLLQPSYLPLIQNTLDTLLSRGYEVRQLKSNFPRVTAEDLKTWKTGSILVNDQLAGSDYWALAKQVSQKFPAATEHLIFTPDRLADFSGLRPVLSSNLHWIIVPIGQKKTWVQEAFQSHPDSVSILLGRSTGSGSRFTNYTFPTPSPDKPLVLPEAPELFYTQQNNQAFITNPASRETTRVIADPLRVAVFHDATRRTDAGYVRAALAALRSYTGRPVLIKLLTDATTINFKPDWLFWLSDAALPAKLQNAVSEGLFVFKDAPNPVKNASATWFSVIGLPEPINLTRQVPVTRENFFKKWQNNYGESILHLVPEGRGGTFYFASRFNTQWNGLPQSGFFPEILGSLVWPEPAAIPDARVISESQLQPVPDFKKAGKPAATVRQLDLKYWFLLLAVIFFLTERWWVFQKAKIST